jgi:hypothetical protein
LVGLARGWLGCLKRRELLLASFFGYVGAHETAITINPIPPRQVVKLVQVFIGPVEAVCRNRVWGRQAASDSVDCHFG